MSPRRSAHQRAVLPLRGHRGGGEQHPRQAEAHQQGGREAERRQRLAALGALGDLQDDGRPDRVRGRPGQVEVALGLVDEVQERRELGGGRRVAGLAELRLEPGHEPRGCA